MIINPGSSGQFIQEMKRGVKNIINVPDKSYGYRIKTKGGTVIEGRVLIGGQLIITPSETSDDIEAIDIIIDDESDPSIKLVK